MPLLDHFHPPLHGRRRWEGFHHSWATFIAQQLNEEALPPGYYAESEISLGPSLEIDVASLELSGPRGTEQPVATAVWSPSKPKIVARVDFAQLESARHFAPGKKLGDDPAFLANLRLGGVERLTAPLRKCDRSPSVTTFRRIGRQSRENFARAGPTDRDRRL